MGPGRKPPRSVFSQRGSRPRSLISCLLCFLETPIFTYLKSAVRMHSNLVHFVSGQNNFCCKHWLNCIWLKTKRFLVPKTFLVHLTFIFGSIFSRKDCYCMYKQFDFSLEHFAPLLYYILRSEVHFCNLLQTLAIDIQWQLIP